MAYLGDPVPCAEPAADAVAMALELRPKMLDLAALWRRRGQPIGFGMGISYGYATLGMIGFEGRNDYTALGSVVNLAARLCGEAGDGEILVDQRTLVADRRAAVDGGARRCRAQGLRRTDARIPPRCPSG